MTYANFGRFYKQEEDREKDNHQKNGGYARSLCTFLTDVEKDRRNPFDIEKLNQLAHILELTKEEKNEMLNLAERREKLLPQICRNILCNEIM